MLRILVKNFYEFAPPARGSAREPDGKRGFGYAASIEPEIFRILTSDRSESTLKR